MIFNKIRVAAAAAVITLGAASAASALTYGTIPGAGAANDGLVPVYGAGTTSVDGYYGATVYLTGGPADITVEYLGSEAGLVNTFAWTGEGTLFSTPGGTGGAWVGGGGASTTVNNVASGLLPFLFTRPGGSVANGANPDGSALGSPPNFFATFYADTGGAALSGTMIDLWWDDGGAGPDDNHDDMGIRLTVSGGGFQIVPVPASIPLLLSGLAGLGIVGRRRARKA